MPDCCLPNVNGWPKAAMPPGSPEGSAHRNHIHFAMLTFMLCTGVYNADKTAMHWCVQYWQNCHALLCQEANPARDACSQFGLRCLSCPSHVRKQRKQEFQALRTSPLAEAARI
eukprot:scaffold180194_cov19-Tisochrysis_lutea.AAC.1